MEDEEKIEEKLQDEELNEEASVSQEENIDSSPKEEEPTLLNDNNEEIVKNTKPKKAKKNKKTKNKINDEEIDLSSSMLISEADLKKKPKNEKKKKVFKKEPIERTETNIETGLSREEVIYRIDNGYVNEHTRGSSKSIKRIILTNIFTFFNILMAFIAGWLLSVGAIKDLFFLVIVTANVVIGIVQEIRAKLTIDKLSILSAPSINVLRDSEIKEISTDELVIDDIIFLETGKQIAADSIVVDGSIEVNESLLTGESDAIIKHVGDRLFSGSYVVSGTCKARVDAVGEDNYIQKLTTQAKQYNKPKSELLNSLNYIITFMAVIIIPIGAILFCMQYKQILGDSSLEEATRKTAGAMIGMIPSGLFLLTSIALAVGVMKLAQNNVLVQELYCIEMLARVDCLCLDKTGTITDGTMTVKNVIEYSSIPGLSVKNIVSAILNATNDGNMTAVALEQKFGRAKRLKSIEVMPFSSQRKLSAATFDKFGTFVMGAPEFVLLKNYSSVSSDVMAGAKQGYRVIAIAHTATPIVDGVIDFNTLEAVCLIYIEDTIRPDAIETIKYFKESGVEVKVISGDNPITVSKVSQRAGIENASEYISLDGLTDKEVQKAATKYTVFGRVSPAQKRLLVMTLKEAGKTVAMTGDGVNDILALKEADCSISVASGSDAARNVSHLVLLDNNFSSMPKVVSEGRRVINNVAKVSKLFLTKTIFSLLLALYAINSGGNYPISTNQLFMIDLFCIGIPSFVLVLEPCNEKSSGNFLANIVKGALPGAIVILFNAIIVLALSNSLNLSSRDTSTLIVIVATFTCLIVLYQTCKPWVLYKKFMYAFLFLCCLFIIVLLPKFLDITPISKVGVYYEKDLVVRTANSYPKVDISQSGFYVIDGKYTEYSASKTVVQTNDNGYLRINNTTTDYKLNVITSASLEYQDGKYIDNVYMRFLILGGKETSLTYNQNLDVQVTNEGDVYVEGQNVNVNVLPTVIKDGNGYYVIDGETTNIQAQVSTIRSVELYNYQIYINGESIGYSIDPVNIGISSNGYLTVGGDLVGTLMYSNIDTSLIDINSQMQYTYDGNVVTYSDSSGNAYAYKLQIDLDESEAGHYVVDDVYTKYTTSKTGTSITYSVTEDGYLKIDSTTTDISVAYTTTKGGEVSTLSLPAILLLLLLCMLTTPLMTLFRAIVPWCKSLIDSIQKLLSKM